MRRAGSTRSATLVSLVLAAWLGGSSAWASPAGDGDTGFHGTGAVALMGPPGTGVAGSAVVVAPLAVGGGIYVEGVALVSWGDPWITVTHVLPDGTLDPSFGDATDSCAGKPNVAFAVAGTVCAAVGYTYTGATLALQSDGKLLVAGAVKAASTNQSYGLGVARLDANGTLDSGFGAAGVADTNPCPSPGQSGAASVAIGPGGSVVLVGVTRCDVTGTTPRLAVAEYDTNGNPLNGFGGTNVLQSDPNTAGWDGTVDAAGNVTAVGEQDCPSGAGGTEQSCRLLVRRFTSAGALDAAFASGGTFTSDPNSAPVAIAYTIATVGTQSVVTGACQDSSGQWSICGVRLSSTGAPDPSFGTGGTMYVADENKASQTMAVQSNGDLVFGTVGLAARTDPDGKALDTSFGSGGIASCPPTTFPYTGCAFNGITVDDAHQRIYGVGATSALGVPCSSPAESLCVLYAAAFKE